MRKRHVTAGLPVRNTTRTHHPEEPDTLLWHPPSSNQKSIHACLNSSMFFSLIYSTPVCTVREFYFTRRRQIISRHKFYLSSRCRSATSGYMSALCGNVRSESFPFANKHSPSHTATLSLKLCLYAFTSSSMFVMPWYVCGAVLTSSCVHKTLLCMV